MTIIIYAIRTGRTFLSYSRQQAPPATPSAPSPPPAEYPVPPRRPRPSPCRPIDVVLSRRRGVRLDRGGDGDRVGVLGVVGQRNAAALQEEDERALERLAAVARCALDLAHQQVAGRKLLVRCRILDERRQLRRHGAHRHGQCRGVRIGARRQDHAPAFAAELLAGRVAHRPGDVIGAGRPGGRHGGAHQVIAAAVAGFDARRHLGILQRQRHGAGDRRRAVRSALHRSDDHAQRIRLAEQRRMRPQLVVLERMRQRRAGAEPEQQRRRQNHAIGHWSTPSPRPAAQSTRFAVHNPVRRAMSCGDS